MLCHSHADLIRDDQVKFILGYAMQAVKLGKGEGLSDDKRVIWSHILREANRVADNLGINVFFYFSRNFISNALRADVTGIYFLRGFMSLFGGWLRFLLFIKTNKLAC
jgi:hypothetical protein